MKSLFGGFRSQLAVTAIAALSLVNLTAMLVRDVIVGAEERLAADAELQCARAAEELLEQYRERLEFRDGASLETLPPEAQNVSLTAMSATVLRAFEGVEGGFFVAGRVTGRARSAAPGATSLLTGAESALLKTLEGGASSARVDDGQDIVVGAVRSAGSGSISAWTLKRLPNANTAVPSQRAWLLGGLAISALLGFAALLSISLQLRRGVDDLQEGLERLESNLFVSVTCRGGRPGQRRQGREQNGRRSRCA